MTDNRSNRVLLVGEDNPLSDAPEHALYNYPPACSGWRLQRTILGLDDETYLALDRTNLCVGGWRAPKALVRAMQLTQPSTPFRVIVALGAKVNGAFRRALRLETLAPFTVWRDESAVCETPGLAPLTIVALPHPSGRCTAWNNPANVARVRQIMREVAPHVPWGGYDQWCRDRGERLVE